MEDLKKWNKLNTHIDKNGVTRLNSNDSGTPSPSRLMQMINMFTKSEIPSHMVIRTIKKALETHDDNYKLLQDLGVAKWVNPVSTSKSGQYARMIYDQLSVAQRKNVFLTQYGVRGSEVHNAIEEFHHTGSVMSEFTSDDAKQRYEGFSEWYDKSGWHIKESELFVLNRTKKSKGIIDAIMTDEDGKLWIVDFKTNAKIEEDFIGIQLMFYRQALLSWGIDIPNLAIIHIGKGGKIKLHKLQSSMLPVYEKIFKELVNIYEYTEYLNSIYK